MWPQLIIVTLLAAIAQGIVGFGFTLLAVSFYLLILRSTDAVQLVLLMNFAIAIVLVSRLWRQVPRRLWTRLAAGGLLGFPVGLWVFARADLEFVELAIAIVTITFAAIVLGDELLGNRQAAVPAASAVAYRGPSAVAVGMTAGALTSSLGAPGPPIAIYLAALGLDKTTFRALAQSTFIVMQMASLIGQSVYVGIDRRVWGYALVLVPVAALGASIGHALCGYVGEKAFRRFVLVLLLATGAYMLYQGFVV